MNIIRLTKKNIYKYKHLFEFFFDDNISSWVFFHPHNPTWEDLNDIIQKSDKDYYCIGLGEDIICYGLLRGLDEGYEIPSLGIIIDKKRRNNGYSKILMEHLESIAKKINVKKIRLTVLKQNYNAIALYNSIGYNLEELDENNLIGFKQI